MKKALKKAANTLVISMLVLLGQACVRVGQPNVLWWEPTFEEAGQVTVNSCCNEQQSYQPDTLHPTHQPPRIVRINVHWLNNSRRTANLDDWRAVNYTRGLIDAANYALANNRAMWLPHMNNTPVLPIGIQYELTGRPGDPNDDGIYFHYDDNLYEYIHIGRPKANYASRKVIDTYGVQLDTVLNWFIMPYHADSTFSPTFKGGIVGVALGNAIKIAGPWLRLWGENEESFWQSRGAINHEMGHIYGLSHAWNTEDGCADTPRHKLSCFNRDGTPACDTLASNNVMDYCALQLAWTPCQIGKVHQRMSSTYSPARKLLKPTWCELQPDKHVFITDTVVWTGAKDLQGHLTVKAGGRLHIKCRVSLPPAGRLTVEAGGVLVLDNAHLHSACEQPWQGIALTQREGRWGQIIVEGKVLMEDYLLPKVLPLGTTAIEGNTKASIENWASSAMRLAYREQCLY